MGKKKRDEALGDGFGLRTGLRFESILVNAEQSLRLELDRARLESDHSLSVGEQAEHAVRDMLRTLVPAGYGVGSGHIYDAYGDRSRQTDVVITNPEHPLSFPEGRAGTYLVDGVSAAGEVKATLSPSKLDDCILKGTKHKQLRMTANSHDFVGIAGHTDLLKQMGLVPPYFVLAFDSAMKFESVLKRLRNSSLVPPPDGKSEGPHDQGDTPQPPIDTVCVLGQGLFLYVRPDNPMGLRVGVPRDPDDAGNPRSIEPAERPDWIFIPTDAPLAWLLTWLHSSMPRIMRGGSVFQPYLIPNQKNLRYMAKRGYITAAGAASMSDVVEPQSG
ncbi:DUF6602 domain-containing protein [Mycobacterium sp. 4D054]|uniref:DUF6602 domain-containing protein n=1 Tax=Mycobacterium sp. 4D054 TaxID=3457440 RepID=UPI003FCFD325